MARNGSRWLSYAGLFVLAFGVRLIYLSELRDTVLFSVLLGDGQGYDRWAREIAGGNWFGAEVFYQAPLYPYFVASVYRFIAPDPGLLRMVQALLGSVACVLLARAGEQFLDRRVGLCAGLLLALYGPAIYFDGLFQKGSLDVFFMVLLLFALGEFLRQRGGGWLVVAGMTLGAFALTRENALILPPVVAIWLLAGVPGETVRRRSAWIGILLAALAAVLVPVGLRNQRLGGQFLITTSQLGPNFYIGNHTGANGRYVPLREGRGSVRYERRDATELAEAETGQPLSPAGVSRYWLRRSLREMGASPAAWLALMAHKWLLVWNAGEIMDTDSIEAHREASVLLGWLGSFSHFGLLAPLAAVGIWVTRGHWRRLWLLHVMLLTLAGAVALFFVMARYRHPLAPVLALFASAGLIEIVHLLRTRSWPRLIPLAFLGAVAAIVCNWPFRAAVDPRTIAYYSLGRELVEQGRLEEGRVQLERAVAIDPGFTDARFKLGDALTNLGRPGEALAPLAEAIRLAPESTDALTGMGTALLQLGRTEEAATYFMRALSIDPAHPSAHNNLAVLLARAGRFAEAIPHWEKALDLTPEDVEVRTNLGKVLLVQGEIARAREAFEWVLSLSPGHDQARRGLEAVRLAEATSTTGESDRAPR